jgi:hypothetical protein
VNLYSVKKNVDSGVFDPSEVMSDKSVEEVVSAWAEVKKKGMLSFTPHIALASMISF